MLLVALVSCGKSVSYTYTSDLGDEVTVSMKTKNGYVLEGNASTFTVLNGSKGEHILDAFFLMSDTATTYQNFMKEDSSYRDLKHGSFSGFYYRTPTDVGMEHTMILYLTDNTAVCLSTIGEESDFNATIEALSFSIAVSSKS